MGPRIRPRRSAGPDFFYNIHLNEHFLPIKTAKNHYNSKIVKAPNLIENKLNFDFFCELQIPAPVCRCLGRGARPRYSSTEKGFCILQGNKQTMQTIIIHTPKCNHKKKILTVGGICGWSVGIRIPGLEPLPAPNCWKSTLGSFRTGVKNEQTKLLIRVETKHNAWTTYQIEGQNVFGPGQMRYQKDQRGQAVQKIPGFAHMLCVLRHFETILSDYPPPPPPPIILRKNSWKSPK